MIKSMFHKQIKQDIEDLTENQVLLTKSLHSHAKAIEFLQEEVKKIHQESGGKEKGE